MSEHTDRWARWKVTIEFKSNDGEGAGDAEAKVETNGEWRDNEGGSQLCGVATTLGFALSMLRVSDCVVRRDDDAERGFREGIVAWLDW